MRKGHQKRLACAETLFFLSPRETETVDLSVPCVKVSDLVDADIF